MKNRLTVAKWQKNIIPPKNVAVSTCQKGVRPAGAKGEFPLKWIGRHAHRLILKSIFLLFIYIFIPVDSSALVYIDINAPVLEKFPIAITPLKNLDSADSGLENRMRGAYHTLRNDLDSTGFFDVLDPVMFLEDPNKAGITISSTDFDDWTIIGAEGLVKGGYRVKNDGMLEVEMRLFDTFLKQMIIGKKYIGTKADIKRIMHRFANEILLKFTGERGIFGSKISYVQDTNGYKEIFVMDYDGNNIFQITRDFSINLSPAWSPDGLKLSYTSYKHGNPDLVINDFVKRETLRVSKRRGLNLGAEWAPDGKKAALTLSRGNNSDIYIIDAVTGEIVKRLTKYWGIDVSPTWSPDGEKIAFTSDRSGNPNIYVANIRAGEIKRITYDGKYNSSPEWSPAGDKIVFCGRTKDGKFNIFTMNTDGSDLLQLTSQAGDNEHPTWSPDSRRIAFASNRAGKYEIFVINADGTNIRRLTDAKGDSTSPSWSPRLE